MVSTILILTLAVTALVGAWSLLNRNRQASRLQDCEEQPHGLDLQILRSLLDRNDFNYLQRSLSRKDFQSLLRKRILLTLEMLRLLEKNASLLMGAAVAATASNTSGVRAQPEDQIAGTVELRVNLLLAKLCLCVQWLFPSSSFLPEWTKPYQHLLNSLEKCRLQPSL